MEKIELVAIVASILKIPTKGGPMAGQREAVEAAFRLFDEVLKLDEERQDADLIECNRLKE